MVKFVKKTTQELNTRPNLEAVKLCNVGGEEDIVYVFQLLEYNFKRKLLKYRTLVGTANLSSMSVRKT